MRHSLLARAMPLAILLALVASDRAAVALTIQVQNQSSVTGATNSTAIAGAIADAVSTIEGLYTNNVTIPVQFYYLNLQSTDPFALETSSGGGTPYTPTYANYTNALAQDSGANANNTVLSTAVANLPKGNDSSGSLNVAIPYAQQLMLQQYSLPSAPKPPINFTPFVTINSFFDTTSNPFSYTSTVASGASGQYDATGGIEHELDEILGGGNGGSVLNAVLANGSTCGSSSPNFAYACNSVGSLDLYRYSAPNTPSFTTSGTATAYFSIDGGKTPIVGFEQNSAASQSKWGGAIGDYGDFVPDGTGTGELIQDAFNVTGKYESYTNASPEAAMMQSIGWNPTHPCNVECYNTFATKPKKDAKSYTIVLAGDVTSQINTTETGIDTLVNPFAYVNQVYGGGAGSSSATVTFNGTNTVITYTGTDPISPTDTYDYGGTPHFGFEGTETITPPTIGPQPSLPFVLLDSYWTYTDDTTDDQPTLGVSCTGGGSQFLIFFTEVTLGGNTTGEWNECQGTGVDLTNPTGSAESLSDAGFYLSDTNIPVDTLDLGDFPPPDQSGTLFTDANALDGSVLDAGGSEDVSAVPEPASLLLLIIGFAGLVVARRVV